MIGSLFAHLRSCFDDASKPSEDLASESAEGSPSPLFLESLPLVHRISIRKAGDVAAADALDISQSVAIRLFKWNEKFRERAAMMSGSDWNAFAARTTFNEVSRYFSSRSRFREDPIDEALSIATDSPEGNTFCEVMSLIKNLWQEICSLTVRQRRALLLHSPQLVIYLMQAEISDEDLAAAVEINLNEWHETLDRLPMSDFDIAEKFRTSDDVRPASEIAKSVKKARFDARRKLDRFRKGS